MTYLEAADDRLGRDAQTRFDSAVEAARLGHVFATNLRAYKRWHSSQARQARTVKAKPMSDAAVLSAIEHLAGLFPHNVEYVRQ